MQDVDVSPFGVPSGVVRPRAAGRSGWCVFWPSSACAGPDPALDLFKRLKLMQDVDAVLADAAPMIGMHGLDLGRGARGWCCAIC